MSLVVKDDTMKCRISVRLILDRNPGSVVDGHNLGPSLTLMS